MSIIKNLLDFLYPLENTGFSNSINTELEECQNILMNHGFKVKRSGNLVHNETVQSLIAEKGHVVLNVGFCEKVRTYKVH